MSFVHARPEYTIWGHQPLIWGICHNVIVQDHFWVLKFNQKFWPSLLVFQPRQPLLEAHFIYGGTFAWCNTRFRQVSGKYVDCVFLCQFLVPISLGLGLLGQELYVDQRIYECEKEVETLV